MELNTFEIQFTAAAAHEANRLWCVANGDNSQPYYNDLSAAQKASYERGIVTALSGTTPEQQHEAWLKDRTAEGWVYGPTKDPAKKEHPCMVAYADLPPYQQAKDRIYLAVVRAFAEELAARPRSMPDPAAV